MNPMAKTGTKTDTHADTGRAQAPDSRGSKPFGATLLLFGGLLLSGAGVALTVLPTLVPAYAWITKLAARHGVAGPTVALTGLVFCGLWIALRPRAPEPVVEEPEKDDGPDVALVLEQVASDLSSVRGTLQDLRVEFVYLKDTVQGAQAKADQAESAGAEGSQAAVFRLAASMDQLSGRLEHRLTAQDASVHEALRTLRQEVQTTQAQVAEVRAQIEFATSAPATNEHASAHESETEETIALPSGYEESEDDVHVYVDLDDQQAGLGLLDELDEFGSPQRSKTSPSHRPGVKRQPNPVKGALPAGDDASVDSKLAELRALMSDPSVRRALEASRRDAKH
jgi:hypothetical protein